MELCELGEPERKFYVYSEGIGLGEPFICERAGGDGFLKWIVQPAEFVRNDWWEDGYYYYDEAKVHFTGKRIDGTVFASTREDDLPARFIIGKDDVMQGFSMAVSSMQEGEKAVFIIPPELALTKFGRPASFPGNIPLNQALRFDIELISLVIVTDIRGDEGILKKNIKRGMGDGKPRDLDEVIVNYNACMEDGVSVSMSERVEFKLAEGFFCPAFAIAVETMTEGEEAVFIVKPEYGFEPFGEQGRPSIGNETAVPPGATLYVYLKLISFTTVNHIGEGHTVLIKRTLRRGNSKEHPENQAEVGVRLIGKLQDGVIFDHRGHEGDEPFKFIVDEEQVSDALEEAILTMREGEIASFTIPPQRLQNQLVVIPSGSSVTYEIELVSVVNETEPESLSRAECIETAFRKEKEGDNLFSSNKMLRAYRRYWKAMFIIRPYIEIIKREVAEGTEQEIYQEPVEEETEEEKKDEETDGEEIYEEPVEEIDEEPVQEDLDEGTEKEDIDIGTDEEEIYRKYIYEEEIDEEIKQMFVSFSFKAAECATQLQCYELAKGCYYEILRYDPENVKAQQLAGQPFPEDSVGIDNAAVHRGLWEPKPMEAPPQRRLKQGRHKPQNLIDVPPIKRPDANVPTGDSPATRATSDVNTSRVTTSNENQSSGTITARGRPTGLSSDCALDKLNLTEDKSEKGTK